MKSYLRLSLFVAISILFFMFSDGVIVQAAGTISGTVFQDYNADGIQRFSTTVPSQPLEPGIEGIIVTATDNLGTVETTTTGADGSYTLPLLNGDAARVEFEIPPALDFLFPGVATPSGGSFVQFIDISSGNVTGIDVALQNPAQYCHTLNPDVVTACYVYGDFNETNINSNGGGFNPSAADALVSFPYDPNGNETDAQLDSVAGLPVLEASHGEVGAVWGTVYHRQSDTIFVSAFTKRHVGYGPDGPSAIYAVDATGGGVSTWATLDNAADDGIGIATFTDPHTRDGISPESVLFNDNGAFNAVGQTAFGDMDIDELGQQLFIADLEHRGANGAPVLHILNINADGTLGGFVQTVEYPVPTTPQAGQACTAANLRNGALKFFHGRLYAGLTCAPTFQYDANGSAADDTTAETAQLYAYVYVFEPGVGWTTTPVAELDLNYPRGFLSNGGGGTITGEWEPWIEDSDGSFGRDDGDFQDDNPFGQQVGRPQPWLTDIEIDGLGFMILGIGDRLAHQTGNDNTDVGPVEGVSGGDILRFTPNNATNPTAWTPENNASAGGFTTGGAGTNAGPGGGEYYFEEDFNPTHTEITLGGLGQIYGREDIMISAFDPDDGIFRAGGTIILNHFNGGENYSIQVFGQDADGSFGKAGGIGDIEAFCGLAPIEIGNRVWNDTNGNGLQDPDEAPLAGITVTLFTDVGGVLQQVGTATTDAAGEYLFNVNNVLGTDATPGNEPNVDFIDANGNGIRELIEPLGIQPDTQYEIRIDTTQASLTGLSLTTADVNANADDTIDSDATEVVNNAVINYTTGGAGINDHTLDFGFSPPNLSLGNFVFEDTNNNGLFDAGETPIENAQVTLFDSSGTQVGATQSTDASGNYLFTGLAPGDYTVEVSAPAGFFSSTDIGSSADPNNDTNDDDNGIGATNTVTSNPITLTVGGEPINDGDTDPDSNLSLDFGFFQPLSLGDQVFFDANNNGLFDAGEAPIENAQVTLFDSSGTQVGPTQSTDASGNYLFSNLVPGDYTVAVSAPAGFFSSTDIGSSADPNNDTNDDDNGIGSGTSVTSNTVTLASGTEPTDDGDTDPDSNLSLDFGFFTPVSLGDTVWLDANNNGLLDAGETGIENVTVELLDSGGAVIATDVTDANGNYLFSDLPPGDYSVRITAPAGLASSTTDSSDPNDDVNDDDNGVNINNDQISSNTMTLTSGGEPTDDGDTDANSNLSLDFGLFEALSLGDTVWQDLNDNGTIDTNESGLEGVTINLYLPTDLTTPIDTTTTDANGNYLFSGLVPGDYVVAAEIPGSHTSSTDIATSADPNNDVNDDDNGVTTTGNLVFSNAIQLVSNAEPTDDGDTSPNTNLTLDFGFVPVRFSLGNRVWLDDDDNGQINGTEAGIENVILNLLDSSGQPVTDDSGNIITTVTDSTGHYLFDNLLPGDYIVEVAQPNFTTSGVLFGLNSSTTDELDPNSDGDSNDNGLGIVFDASQGIRSDVVTLSEANEPINETDVGSAGSGSASDENSNLTVDFGFTPQPANPVSLGNRVWLDLNDNGLLDTGEAGIENVLVNLYASDGTTFITSTTTDADGYYLFDGLTADDYIVEIAASNFAASAVLFDFNSSTPDEADPNADVDSNDNGLGTTFDPTNGIRSAVVTVSEGTEPTSEPDPGTAGSGFASDPDSNLTVDFGFVPPAGLFINKTNGQNAIVAGESTTYTITITNTGSDTGDIPFSDTVPTDDPNGFLPDSINWTCEGFNGAVCGETAGTNSDLDFTVNLPTDSEIVIEVTATLNPNASNATITNTATVDTTEGGDTDGIIFDPPTGQKVGFTIDETTIRWEATWINTGAPQQVIIEDVLQAGQTFAGNLSCQALGTSVQVSCTESNNVVVWTGTIGTGQDNRVTITFDVTVSGPGQFNNISQLLDANGNMIATASATETISDPNPEPVNDTGTPELELIKVVDPPLSRPGEIVTWQVFVNNSGNGDAANLLVTDTLPDGLTLINTEVTTGTIDVNGNSLQWTIPSLPANQDATLTIITRLNDDAATTLTNIARVDDTLTADASVVIVSELPRTGETPVWRHPLMALLVSILAVLLVISGRRSLSHRRE